ncbi:hypothetical protein TNCV_4325161 [Trichonephila clavipes]|nr:hypothetical protein TNCV_4325161 [Trichonephila clavipes]
MPHEPTEADKDWRAPICPNLLKYQRKDNILNPIVPCDEKGIYFNNINRKGDCPTVSVTVCSFAKRNLTNKKIMLLSGGISMVLSPKSI